MKMLKKLFPFLAWGPLMDRHTIGADFIAGITVALVLIPQSMAYAQLAGLPPIYGLYAALMPGLIGVLWGSSYHLGTGPVAMTSLLTMTTLLPFANGDVNFVGSERYIGLAILLAFIVGVVRLLVGVFKLTFFINFLSQPVVRGFINAGALIIASSQVGKIFGVKMHKSDVYIADIWDLLLRLPSEIHLPTLIIGGTSLVLLWGLKKYTPKIPSALVVVALGSLAVWFLNLADPRLINADFVGFVAADQKFVNVIGIIPAGLPAFQAPMFDFALILQILPGAFAVMFIGFMEVTSVTKAISPKSKQKVNLDQELIGQGLSAIAGSFSSCYPTSGSFSRTALNFSSGGKTGLSGVFVALFVLLSLLFLTPLLIFLPDAVLAAIIIMAVIGLIDFKAFKQAWRVHVYDGISGIVTFCAAILFAPNIVNGIVIGGLLALALHLFRTMSPRVVIKSGLESDLALENDSQYPNSSAKFPTMEFEGRIYFANTQHFENAVLTILDRFPNTEKVVVLANGIGGIDASGDLVLRELIETLRGLGKDFIFIGVRPQVQEILVRADLWDLIGDENFFTDTGAFQATLK
ncbi:MAG: SulP family inorganic anion transporter [SAR324 cluster bacterium]|nr:SulP family inorganic anion transporter [SAR324 cluster bacterium]